MIRIQECSLNRYTTCNWVTRYYINKLTIFYFFIQLFTLPQYRIYTHRSDACMGAQTLDQNTRNKRTGLPWICDQQNVRATVRDNTGQNIKDIPRPRIELKFLFPPRIESGPPDCKTGTLPATPRWLIKYMILWQNVRDIKKTNLFFVQ